MGDLSIRHDRKSTRTVRYFGNNNSELSKTLEKLSSGYRVNRSADDAAGLSISEKMRLQFNGLDQAMNNSKDGSRLIQVGEGSLSEVHDILKRLATLSEQSANGTYDDSLDRASMQRELEQMCAEVDRIAESANFNGIKLFQDNGFDFECSKELARQRLGSTKGIVDTLLESRGETPRPTPGQVIFNQTASDEGMTLDDLIANTKEGELNIVYIEHDVQTTQTASGSSGKGTATDLNVYDNGTTKKLSEVLKTEIVPQTVTNVLRQYSAFSYLTGSTIGIGLSLYSDSSSSVLASVSSGTSLYSNGTGSQSYTLNVNVAKLSGISNSATAEAVRSELESTIAHEMIHAFMDEAVTAGMFGFKPGTNQSSNAYKFPDWFIEGMAQTSSGPGNWISAGLRLDASSTEAAIKSAISSTNNKLGSGTTASQYGTGYLACMYLGAAIAGNGTPAATTDPSILSANISSGLNKLLTAVIQGTPLTTALNTLTNGNFTSLSDFITKFNNGTANGLIGTGTSQGFVHNLLEATGSGMGGLIRGNVTSTDPAANTPLTGVNLFNLDADNKKVVNKYPDGYLISSGGSGGTTAVTGSPPTGYAGTTMQCGNLVVTGGDLSGINYNSATGELTVTGAGDIRISMKTGAPSSVEKIILAGGGKVTLDGVQLTASDSLTIQGNTTIKTEGRNSFSDIKVTSGAKATFEGSGQLKTSTFTGDSTGTATFNSGAVIVGNNGTGTITGVTVRVNGASVAANIADSTNPLTKCPVTWTDLSGFKNIYSAKLGSGTAVPMLLDNSEPSPALWLNYNTINTQQPTYLVISGEDSAGNAISKTFQVKTNGVNTGFTLTPVDIYPNPFTVTGGVEGVDWRYDSDTKTLNILTGKALTIKGGAGKDINNADFVGRISLADNIATSAGSPIKLTLDGVTCTSTDKSAFSLGEGNNVELHLVDGTQNTFKSGSGYAGISVGTETTLKITGGKYTTDTTQAVTTGTPAANAGILTAVGGQYGAGIGRDWNNNTQAANKSTDTTSSITIEGGVINATGGFGAAGIGGSRTVDIGDITIKNADVTAHGGADGGAGIGASNGSNVGKINIEESNINASATNHGAGIGGGWGIGGSGPTVNGDITIKGSIVSAVSNQTHGSGIGTGCSGTGGSITIIDSYIKRADGGDYGAGIGSSNGGSCGAINISGNSTVVASGGINGAGIGANGRCQGITIDTTGTITATGGNNGAGIGSGSSGTTGAISVKGTIDATGGDYGAGIGSGRSGSTGAITVEGTINATGGKQGAGIGSGTGGSTGLITIKDGVINAKGDKNSSGIGSGMNGSVSGVVVDAPNGVSITSDGGWTSDGGNIGGYTDKSGTNKASVTIKDPEKCTIKAGESGEGKYITTGAKDADGNTLYALRLSYIDELLSKNKLNLISPGMDGTSLSYPIDSLDIVLSDGTSYSWHDLQHQNLTQSGTEEDAYVWMKGLDIATLRVTDADGTVAETKDGIKFFEDHGKWRLSQKELPKDPPPEPGYEPDDPVPTPDPPTPKPPKPVKEEEPDCPGIILQVGAEYGQILEIPRFYLSAKALNMDLMDISDQDKAMKTMDLVKIASNRVSDIRGTYGALTNRLDHNINNLGNASQNIAESESHIRDADMAQEMMKYTKQSILMQSTQAMLAQCNQHAADVMQLLQQ